MSEYKQFGSKSIQQQKMEALDKTLTGLADIALDYKKAKEGEADSTQASILRSLESLAIKDYDADYELEIAQELFDTKAKEVVGDENIKIANTMKDVMTRRYNGRIEAEYQAQLMQSLEDLTNNASTFKSDQEYTTALNIFDNGLGQVRGSVNQSLAKNLRKNIVANRNILRNDTVIQSSIAEAKNELSKLSDELETSDIIDVLGNLDQVAKQYRGNSSASAFNDLNDHRNDVINLANLSEDISGHDTMPKQEESFEQFKQRYPIKQFNEEELKSIYEHNKIVKYKGYQLDDSKMQRAYKHLQRGEYDKAQEWFDKAEQGIQDSAWDSWGNIVKERSSDSNSAMYYKDSNRPKSGRELVHPDLIPFQPEQDQNLDRRTLADLRQKYEHNIKILANEFEDETYTSLSGVDIKPLSYSDVDAQGIFVNIVSQFAKEGKTISEITLSDLQEYFAGFETGGLLGKNEKQRAIEKTFASLIYGYLTLEEADEELSSTRLETILR